MRVEAITDPVTGIANRKHFQDMLHKSVEAANAGKSALALIVIDIDHFKRFNDLYGHLTGDQVLRLVSMTMREQVKSKATLARFGGEEFGIIMPETSLEDARAMAEEIRQSVLNRELVKRSTGESLGKITISVGVSEFRRGETGTALLDRADQCMYIAKRTGRNRTVTDAEHSGRASGFRRLGAARACDPRLERGFQSSSGFSAPSSLAGRRACRRLDGEPAPAGRLGRVVDPRLRHQPIAHGHGPALRHRRTDGIRPPRIAPGCRRRPSGKSRPPASSANMRSPDIDALTSEHLPDADRAEFLEQVLDRLGVHGSTRPAEGPRASPA